MAWFLILALLAGAAPAAPAGQTPGPARAQPKFSATFDKCMDAAAGVTLDMHNCISAELDRQDARLNQTYKAALARLNTSQQTRLRETERRWLRETKARCDHAGDENEGGTAQALQVADCYLTETTGRADFLARYRP